MPYSFSSAEFVDGFTDKCPKKMERERRGTWKFYNNLMRRRFNVWFPLLQCYNLIHRRDRRMYRYLSNVTMCGSQTVSQYCVGSFEFCSSPCHSIVHFPQKKVRTWCQVMFSSNKKIRNGGRELTQGRWGGKESWTGSQKCTNKFFAFCHSKNGSQS